MPWFKSGEFLNKADAINGLIRDARAREVQRREKVMARLERSMASGLAPERSPEELLSLSISKAKMAGNG